MWRRGSRSGLRVRSFEKKCCARRGAVRSRTSFVHCLTGLAQFRTAGRPARALTRSRVLAPPPTGRQVFRSDASRARVRTWTAGLLPPLRRWGCRGHAASAGPVDRDPHRRPRRRRRGRGWGPGPPSDAWSPAPCRPSASWIPSASGRPRRGRRRGVGRAGGAVGEAGHHPSRLGSVGRPSFDRCGGGRWGAACRHLLASDDRGDAARDRDATHPRCGADRLSQRDVPIDRLGGRPTTPRARPSRGPRADRRAPRMVDR